MNTIQPVFGKENRFEQSHFCVQQFWNHVLKPVKVRHKAELFAKYAVGARVNV